MKPEEITAAITARGLLAIPMQGLPHIEQWSSMMQGDLAEFLAAAKSLGCTAVQCYVGSVNDAKEGLVSTCFLSAVGGSARVSVIPDKESWQRFQQVRTKKNIELINLLRELLKDRIFLSIATQPSKEAYARKKIPALNELDPETLSAEVGILKGEIIARGLARTRGWQ